MRVLFLTNIPAPYTVERLNTLAKVPGLDISAAFLERTHADRAWRVDEESWRFPGRYIGVGAGAAAGTARVVFQHKPDVLWTLYERPEYLSAIAACKARGGKVVIHVMKTYDWWGHRRWYREQAKRLLFPLVAIHAPGADARAYAQSYGARPERVFAFPECVDVHHFATGAAVGREQGENLGEAMRFVYVGRLIEGKGIGFLLDAFAGLRSRGIQASLAFVGSGVDEEKFRKRAATIDGVTFLGFVEKERLPRFYGAADALVFPTLGDAYGYVIEEAMASGLPVITTTAVAEVAERVTHGVTGFVVPPGDAQALEASMFQLASDPSLRERMGEAASEQVAPRTVEWWATQAVAMLRRVSES